MATIPAGVIIGWPASLSPGPGAGWVREATLDGLHPLSYSYTTPIGSVGGAVTHTHSGGAHSHPSSNSTHDHVLTFGSANPKATVKSGSVHQAMSPSSHSHTLATGSTNIAASLISVPSMTSGSGATEDAYLVVVWFKSDGTPTKIPAGALVYSDAPIVPINFEHFADTKGKYLKGTVSGAGGGATGGSSSHQHTINHAHSVPDMTHQHSAGQSNTVGASGTVNVGGTVVYLVPQHEAHSHGYNPTYRTVVGSCSTVTITLPSQMVSPPYMQLAILRAVTDADIFPGMITIRTTVPIPPMWDVCDGTHGTRDLLGRFVKGCTLLGAIGNAGGGLTHTHPQPVVHSHSISHRHETGGGEPHTSLEMYPGNKVGVGSSAQVQVMNRHFHSASCNNYGFASGNGQPAQFGSSGSLPPFRTVYFVRYRGQQSSVVSVLNPATDLCEVAYKIPEGVYYATGKLADTPTLADLTAVLVGTSYLEVDGIAILPDGTRVLYVTDATGIIKLISKDLGKTWS